MHGLRLSYSQCKLHVLLYLLYSLCRSSRCCFTSKRSGFTRSDLKAWGCQNRSGHKYQQRGGYDVAGSTVAIPHFLWLCPDAKYL
ncbi:hypothetical protein PR003_g6547 [Phytophthora rubi]|uniref:Secreted protein n=1 Tax=Phytophthora rubi TaxID=129364 RepID=A0A6A3N9J8_9STRA|nr:hypothetical protein PR002_g17831 [Phytophthora rubi]KAE9037734.1 hypothetical protein PR001_g8261 [Phytophthora rubi]KAE9348181.1 hypothetical protein PR003_g6547 [Phytophthora rubi]